MNEFVPLKMQVVALNELQNTTFSSNKFVLLVGKSGLGKSFLLQKLCEDGKFVLFSQPFFDENAFCEALCEIINQKGLSFQSLYTAFQHNTSRAYIFVCDEVGMYEEGLFEKMRILSDLPHICFILSTHKKHALFHKEHFASRIGKEIWLKSLNLEDLALYAKEKFALSLFTQRQLKWLLKTSDSNLRSVDKILNTFKTLLHFYEGRNAHKSTRTLLEMSAFYHKLLR